MCILFGRKPDGSETAWILTNTALPDEKLSDRITPTEVAEWFRKSAPHSLDADTTTVRALAHNLNVVRNARCDDQFVQSFEPLDRVRKALATLAKDLPLLIDGSARSSGKPDPDMKHLLRSGERTRARLLPRRRGKRDAPWHDIAALVMWHARSVWQRPIGAGEESPVVRLVGLALARIGEPERSPEAISKALKRHKGATVEFSDARPITEGEGGQLKI